MSAFGNGTEFLRSDGADPAVLEKMGGALMELGAFTVTREIKDNNRYGDNGQYKKKRGGRKEVGEVTAKLEFEHGDKYHLKIMADMDKDESVRYAMQWPDEDKTEVQFDALVSEFSFSHEDGEYIYFNVKFSVDGEPVWGNYT